MRKSGIIGSISFIAGVVVGVAATYRIAEQKYRNIAEEEIASVKEVFENRKPVVVENTPRVTAKLAEVKQAESRVSYSSIIKKTGYDTLDVKPSQDEEELQKMSMHDDAIHVITYDEFATIEGFGEETFYYTADNCVLDSELQELCDDEINDAIGGDPLEYTMDADIDGRVFIRNDRRKVDYEIIISQKNYSELRPE